MWYDHDRQWVRLKILYSIHFALLNAFVEAARSCTKLLACKQEKKSGYFCCLFHLNTKSFAEMKNISEWFPNWSCIVLRVGGKSVAQVALRWLLQTPPVTSVIIGATKVHQLEDNMGVVGWRLTEDEVCSFYKRSVICFFKVSID